METPHRYDRYDYRRKFYDLKTLDVDAAQKMVKVAISEVESVDRDKDAFDAKAWDKTIKERGPQGSNEVWHLLDHDKTSFSALSKFHELFIQNKHLAGWSRYKNSFAWREVAWPLYESGDFTQHSVGFTVVREEKSSAGYNIIKEASLWEGSAVLWGANPNTPTMQVVKSLLHLDEEREITAAEKIDELIKRLKEGKYDEKADLLAIELKRLQNLFETKNIAAIVNPIEQKSTEPEADTSEKSTQPEIVKVDYAALFTNYITKKAIQ